MDPLDVLEKILVESVEEEDPSFFYSLCDTLHFHELSQYSGFYRATFEVFMARSQPHDSDSGAEERLLIAEALLEEENRKAKELCQPSEPRVKRTLTQVHSLLLNDLVECPPPGHPDRRETRKLYQRREETAETEVFEDEEDQGWEDVDNQVDVDQAQGLTGDTTVHIAGVAAPASSRTFEKISSEPTPAAQQPGITSPATPPIRGPADSRDTAASDGKKQEDGPSKQQNSKPFRKYACAPGERGLHALG